VNEKRKTDSAEVKHMSNPFYYDFDPKNPRHWWFGDCPKEELLCCWHYEYTRDCPSAIQKILEYRENVAHPKSPSEVTKFYSQVDETQLLETRIVNLRRNNEVNHNSIAYLFPEWPDSPYLQIQPKFRTERLEILRKLGAPLREFIARQQIRSWLKANRNEKSKERRGNAAFNRKSANRLKALGAYRLCAVMSMDDAIKHAVALDHKLYTNQPEMSKVCRQVANYLEWLDSTYMF
jgi:hypothetical protein